MFWRSRQTCIFMRRNFPRLRRRNIASVNSMQAAVPVQQLRRTYIRYRGKVLSYFGGCDYFRLASHPKVLAAVQEGLRRFGLNVAASRVTTGNHEVYVKLERALAQFFHAETALLANSGYVTNLMVAQALAGQFSHVLLDERAHVALHDAATLFNCPVLTFKHCDVSAFAATLDRCGKAARPVVLTDGMYAHNGSVAPLQRYLKLLPRDGLIVVDDAHGAGTLGAEGGGAIEIENVNRSRIVQNITLSKAFGVYGGAVICSRRWRKEFLRSRLFVGSTPLPLPLAHAATQAVNLLKTQTTLRRDIVRNAERIKTSLRAARFPLGDFPGPIVPVHLKTPAANERLRTALLSAKILPPFLRYPGSPAGGYFRFVISSEHTPPQLDALARVLAPFAGQLAD